MTTASKPTLAYKTLNGVFRLINFRANMGKDAGTGKQRNIKPVGKLKERWRREEFEGRAVWICEPKQSNTDKVYIHQHGGGYVYGIQHGHFQSCAELADLAGVTVLMPDYPLPPQSTAAAVIEWADRHFSSCVECYGLGTLSMGGDSAGGNLTLAILQKRARRGEGNPEPIILWSPWLDLQPRETPPTKEDDYEPIISPFALEPSVAAYVGEMDRADPLISPAVAELEGLPPMHVVTGGRDILNPEIMTFSERLKAANKLASLKVEPHYAHWWMFYPTKDRHPTLRYIADLLT